MTGADQAKIIPYDYSEEVFTDDSGGNTMSFVVSDEVKHKSGGQRMVVTGYASGMVECRWYDGYGVQREAFREDELVAQQHRQPQTA